MKAPKTIIWVLITVVKTVGGLMLSFINFTFGDNILFLLKTNLLSVLQPADKTFTLNGSFEFLKLYLINLI
jgi:hypothetical protein